MDIKELVAVVKLRLQAELNHEERSLGEIILTTMSVRYCLSRQLYMN